MADVLVIDDQDRYIELLRRAVPEHRYRGPARSWADARTWLSDEAASVDVVLLDVHFDIPVAQLVGDGDRADESAVERLRRRQGLEILSRLRTLRPDLPVILMTSQEDMELAYDGADEFTYFLGDDAMGIDGLRARIGSVLAASEAVEADGPVYWGESLAMRRIRHRLKILARGRLPVVLLGPTGTGKSLLAKHVVHRGSGRKGRFVRVDLSTIPPELMPAQLFGAAKGAYTGATSDRVGAFEAADGGTLFLDEIGNLSAHAQTLLLSVLQEGAITRLGDTRERAVDVKVVVATHEDLAARVNDGSFRADLYMRLNPAAAVHLPALSERQVDVPALLRFSLREAMSRPYLAEMVADLQERLGIPRGMPDIRIGPFEASPNHLVLHFPEPSLALLRSHDWPGNLREFAMTVENATLFAIAEMQFGSPERVIEVRPSYVADLLTSGGRSPERGLPMRVALLAADSLHDVARAVERQYFVQLFERSGGDFGQMASLLLGDRTLSRKVQLRFNQLGLKVRDFQGSGR